MQSHSIRVCHYSALFHGAGVQHAQSESSIMRLEKDNWALFRSFHAAAADAGFSLHDASPYLVKYAPKAAAAMGSVVSK